MKLSPDLIEATFVARLNRFAARMRVGDREVLAHVANSGRLEELLCAGNRMLLAPVHGRPHRKTAFDLAVVEVGGVLVSADARVPNTLLREAIEGGKLPEFSGYDVLAEEVTFEDSRLDMVLSGQPGRCYVEVKSVTLVPQGLALFPDAPTSRGRKHLATLSTAVDQGHQAAVVFVVQRSDAVAFSPNLAADPEFSDALAAAARNGVQVYAYRCSVSREEIAISGAVPVRGVL